MNYETLVSLKTEPEIAPKLEQPSVLAPAEDSTHSGNTAVAPQAEANGLATAPPPADAAAAPKPESNGSEAVAPEAVASVAPKAELHGPQTATLAAEASATPQPNGVQLTLPVADASGAPKAGQGGPEAAAAPADASSVPKVDPNGFVAAVMGAIAGQSKPSALLPGSTSLSQPPGVAPAAAPSWLPQRPSANGNVAPRPPASNSVLLQMLKLPSMAQVGISIFLRNSCACCGGFVLFLQGSRYKLLFDTDNQTAFPRYVTYLFSFASALLTQSSSYRSCCNNQSWLAWPLCFGSL